MVLFKEEGRWLVKESQEGQTSCLSWVVKVYSHFNPLFFSHKRGLPTVIWEGQKVNNIVKEVRVHSIEVQTYATVLWRRVHHNGVPLKVIVSPLDIYLAIFYPYCSCLWNIWGNMELSIAIWNEVYNFYQFTSTNNIFSELLQPCNVHMLHHWISLSFTLSFLGVSSVTKLSLLHLPIVVA